MKILVSAVSTYHGRVEPYNLQHRILGDADCREDPTKERLMRMGLVWRERCELSVQSSDKRAPHNKGNKRTFQLRTRSKEQGPARAAVREYEEGKHAKRARECELCFEPRSVVLDCSTVSIDHAHARCTCGDALVGGEPGGSGLSSSSNIA